MVNAIRIHTTIESETLRIPELAALVGKRVEVIVMEDVEGVEGSTAVLVTESNAVQDLGFSPPPTAATQPRIFGSLHGLLHIPDDFNDPLPEDILRAFEGDE